MNWPCLAAAVCLSSAGFVTSANAALTYDAGVTEEGGRYVVVVGEFEHSDDLQQFRAAVQSHSASFIGFNSPGGNIAKAMELGRLIRALSLDTFQPRGLECASACAFAFLGGAQRFAEPGSIGVHKFSLSETAGLNAEDALRIVQQLTAEILGYLSEMGADPALLEMSLRYENDDMRYLSWSEMEQLKVVLQTTPEKQLSGDPSNVPIPTPTPSYAQPQSPPFPVPEARSGRIRHPKGIAPLKALPDEKSTTLWNAKNGVDIGILAGIDGWYRVSVSGMTGYLHQSWVWVEQFEAGPFDDQRRIQLMSFRTLADSEAYIHSFPRQLPTPVAYLVNNGWFAVTFENFYEQGIAQEVLGGLKQNHLIPPDSFVTYGNTYVRKVCCG